MNNVSLIGRLTSDPELRTTANGTEVLTFTVAVDSSGKEKKTFFIDCVAWRHTAVFISRFFRKGEKIGITGEIQTRSFEDHNGSKRKVTEILVTDVTFCEKKKDSVEFEEIDEDLPFD